MSKSETRKILEEKLGANVSTEPRPQNEISTSENVEQEKPRDLPDGEFLVAPASFEGEIVQTFGLLPHDWRKFLSEHEAQAEQKYKDIFDKLEALSWVAEMFAPRQKRLEKYGISDAQKWFETLVKVDDLFEVSPSEGVRFLAEAYGVKLNALPEVPAAQSDAAIQSLGQKIQMLENECQQLKALVAQRESQQTNFLLMNFLQAKDENGQPKHKYFAQVKPIMFALLNNNLAYDFEDAYQQALWLVPDLRKQMLDEQMAFNLKVKADEAQKAQLASFEAKGKALNDDNEHLSTRQILERVINK